MKTFTKFHRELNEIYEKPLGTNRPMEDHSVNYKDNFHLTKPLTDSERIHIQYYKDDDHDRINFSHRNNSVDEYTNEQSNHLDSAIKKQKTLHPINLWRGVNSNVIKKLNLEPGKDFHDKGYVSSSTNPAVAHEFGSHIMNIHVPKGSNALHLPSHKLGIKAEHEVLLPRNSRFKYYGSTKHGDITVHHVTLMKSKK